MPKTSKVGKARLDGQEQMVSRAAQQLHRFEIAPTLPDNLQGDLRSRTSEQSTATIAAPEEPSPSRGTAATENAQEPQPKVSTANDKEALGYGTLTRRFLGVGKLANKLTRFRGSFSGVSEYGD